jgi:hypothetical protein
MANVESERDERRDSLAERAMLLGIITGTMTFTLNARRLDLQPSPMAGAVIFGSPWSRRRWRLTLEEVHERVPNGKDSNANY